MYMLIILTASLLKLHRTMVLKLNGIVTLRLKYLLLKISFAQLTIHNRVLMSIHDKLIRKRHKTQAAGLKITNQSGVAGIFNQWDQIL